MLFHFPQSHTLMHRNSVVIWVVSLLFTYRIAYSPMYCIFADVTSHFHISLVVIRLYGCRCCFST